MAKATMVWNAIGMALYPRCEDWKSLLARDLGVKPNTLHQWAKGHTILSNPAIVEDIIKVLKSRNRDISLIIKYLEKHIDKSSTV